MKTNFKNDEKNAKKIGFIGCGKMASAIIEGIINSGFVKKTNIMASEINEDFAKIKKEELGIEVLTDNKKVSKGSEIIFLAVKPHFVKEVLQEIKEFISEEKLIVSIAAGVSTKTIQEQFDKNIPVIRVMPNAPMMILEGMSGVVKGRFATQEDVDFVKEMMSQIGKSIVIEETQMDVLTAISGSGPAFFYKIFDDMAKAGEKLGLEYEKSLLLAIQTGIGSAKLMMQSEKSAADLIQAVATKGGCTEVGVNYLQDVDFEKTMFELIEKTAVKSAELG